MNYSAAKTIQRLLVLLLGLTTSLAAKEPPEGPSTEAARYDLLRIEGWTVHQDSRLSTAGEQAELGREVREQLQAKLREVEQRLPRTATTYLRQVPIWIEFDNSRAGPGCCYHPSRQWLASHGFNPDKAKAIEISNARNFIGWEPDQPAAILHEFAHAWHDQVLGSDEPRIRAQWDSVVASGQYDEVQHVNGRLRKHYALNNHKEYFAEMSEAYFWKNDFYPFNQSELREVDPRMHQLVKESWSTRPEAK